MSNESDNNFNMLSKLYKLVTPSDMLGRYDLKKYTDSNVNISLLGKIQEILVNTVDSSGSGLLTYDEIKQRIEGLTTKGFSEQDIEKYVRVYADVNTEELLAPIISASDLSITKTKLSVISLNSPYIGASIRDTNRIGTFLNAIPSVELSRCVPLLEIGFELAFPGENMSDKKSAAEFSARAPTLLRYINGVSSNYGAADSTMAAASINKVNLESRAHTRTLGEQWKNSVSVTSGMELFTTPQTLASPDSTLNEKSRPVPVLDPYTSFMSIDSFEITAAPAGGAMSYKSAKLNITLHDRSRLHEIAALIKPDAYSRTTVSVTYGWSHPDKSYNNPIADLINQMVVRDEKYNIVNSSFSFGGSGGVKITLQLAMKGGSELNVVRISDSPAQANIEKELEELSEAIADAREKIPGLKKPDLPVKNIRVYQLIDAAANNSELLDDYDSKKDLPNLKKFIADMKRPNSKSGTKDTVKGLEEHLDKIVKWVTEKDKDKNKFNASNKDRKLNVNKLLGDKFTKMMGVTTDGKTFKARDPYYNTKDLFWKDNKDIKGIVEKGEYSTKSPRDHVSLAKLMMYYVGLPLKSVGQFDEVQFVYYPLNSEAGAAWGTNLAGFPIDADYFKEVIVQHSKGKRNANMTVREFVQLLNSSILSDIRSKAYGLSSLYNQRKTEDPTGDPTLQGKFSANDITNKLTGYGIKSGVFRKPVIELQIECRGAKVIDTNTAAPSKQPNSMRIVRIHVYDKLSSAYEPTLKVLQAQQSLEKLTGGEETQMKNVVSSLGVGFNFADNKFESYEQLKRVVSQVTPFLTYGSNNSGILAATMQTMQNSDLATVNMQRAMGPQYNSEPNGSSISTLPLRVQPSQLDMTFIGCPLLNLTQQYYVDFNTGTTIDDLYVLTGLSHKIAAGKFESTAKFTPMNAYGSYENILSKIRKLRDSLSSENISKK